MLIVLILFYNPKLYIFDYFEKGFNYKDIDYLKKVLRKLKGNYDKNIYYTIFIDCGIPFWGMPR